MILLYHKIDVEDKTMWWVSADKFYRQLVQLRHKKVVYLDDYDPTDSSHVVITFDGVYSNVLRYAAPLLKQFGYPFELFVTGDTIGKGNEFDTGEPYAKFASKHELEQLINLGGRLQWHTKTHADITTLDDAAVKKEIITPPAIKKMDPKGFKWFGYAYGRFDQRSQDLVRKHYRGGIGSDIGSFDDITIWPRVTVVEDTQLIDEKVTVAITSYNYGHLLIEAIESVLRQTYLPDEIILSDDASSDHSYETMKVYAEKYPGLIKVNRNGKNLGIQKHFNKVVEISSGDFMCFLGADNRFPSNYIESCLVLLLADKKSAISYTDFALFGSRAEDIYNGFPENYRGEKLFNGTYLVHFPEFNAKSKKHLIEKKNFIHGSSMYRRAAYDAAGGYSSREKGPEDYLLFKGMIQAGWGAHKAQNVYLEYRQHSVEQANLQFSYFAELSFLKHRFKDYVNLREMVAARDNAIIAKDAELENLRQKLHVAELELGNIRASKGWKAVRAARLGKHSVAHPVGGAKRIVHHVRKQTKRYKNR